MKSVVLTLALLLGSLAASAVPFTLHNKTLSSIPLIIPNVMNPNLSPMSDSSVDLEVGQQILFKYKGKKYLLLEVTEELRGQTLEVSTLLKERKEELGLK
ncbi:MAG: hypothetical protein NWR72_03070 [Bacteroidia bacterium]|nr:hypothetical protein [Bacteroidia bacterium]